METPAVNRVFWKNPVVVVLSSAVLYLAAQLCGAFLLLPFVSAVPNKNAQTMLLLVGTFVAFVLLLLCGMKLLRFGFKDLGVMPVKARYILLVPAVFFLYIFISQVLTTLATKFPGFNPDQAQDLGLATTGHGNIVLAFVTLIIITPLFEELLFRGLLFHGLRKRLSFGVSAIIASLVFAAAHWQLNVAVDTFALSLMLCTLTERSRSIVPAILLHALKNAFAFGVLFLGWFK